MYMYNTCMHYWITLSLDTCTGGSGQYESIRYGSFSLQCHKISLFDIQFQKNVCILCIAECSIPSLACMKICPQIEKMLTL